MYIFINIKYNLMICDIMNLKKKAILILILLSIFLIAVSAVSAASFNDVQAAIDNHQLF